MLTSKEISRPQAIALTGAFVVLLGLLFWAGARFRAGSPATVKAVEMRPVAEEIVASPREEPTTALTGPMSDEAVRREEALQNLRWGVQHSR